MKTEDSRALSTFISGFLALFWDTSKPAFEMPIFPTELRPNTSLLKVKEAMAFRLAPSYTFFLNRPPTLQHFCFKARRYELSPLVTLIILKKKKKRYALAFGDFTPFRIWWFKNPLRIHSAASKVLQSRTKIRLLLFALQLSELCTRLTT